MHIPNSFTCHVMLFVLFPYKNVRGSSNARVFRKFFRNFFRGCARKKSQRWFIKVRAEIEGLGRILIILEIDILCRKVVCN